MDILLRPTATDVAVAAADILADFARRGATLGLATGSTPVATYRELIRRYDAGEVSFADCRAFLLDEYIGLPRDHEQSYHRTIRREFTSHVDIPDEAVHGPDPEQGAERDPARRSLADDRPGEARERPVEMRLVRRTGVLRGQPAVRAVQEFDRIFQRQHMTGAFLVDLVDQGGQRRCFAAAGRSGHENQASRPLCQAQDAGRNAQRDRIGQLCVDAAHRNGAGTALTENISAKSA